VNPTIGLISLSLIYGLYGISSTLLPSIVSKYSRSSQTLAISQVCYSFYTIANFYPTFWTLIPSAIALGVSAGPFWSTARMYVAQLAEIDSKISGKSESEKSGKFFGIFYSFQISQVVGNLLVWLTTALMSLNKKDDDVITTPDANMTSLGNLTDMMTSLSNSTDLMTSLSNSTDMMTSLSNSTDLMTSSDSTPCGIFYTKEVTSEPREVNHLALGLLLLLQIFAIFIFLKIPDIISIRGDVITREPLTSQAKTLVDKNDNRLLPVDKQNDVIVKTSLSSDNLSLIRAMFRLLSRDKTAILLLALSFHCGFLHCTVIGDVTKSWVTCTHGVTYVPSMMICYGLVSTLTCLLAGSLFRWIAITKLVYITLIFETLIFIGLLLWQPTSSTSTLVVYGFLFSFFGITNGLNRTLIADIFSLLFTDPVSAGMALLGATEAASSSLLFGLGDVTAPIFKIILTMTSSVVGGATFKIAWKMRNNETRFRSVTSSS